jgi:SpoVK/Ycf46/Vps4 family AAA+-type ATPase
MQHIENIEEAMGKWVSLHSKRIREIFDEMVEENPAILDDWKDPAKRDAILNRIESELYANPQELAA